MITQRKITELNIQDFYYLNKFFDKVKLYKEEELMTNL